ncbi:YcaO-like family protein [Nonomuraea purpurea]|uniref:YcaO-like family protein n=1 Tax=Nonomuraea purpurea TaxID=1849276 RepID=A0ABV8G313_9ACTN
MTKDRTAGGRHIVFLGPSIGLDLARRTLPDADFRPPIRRGDLDALPEGAVVGIVDGVFDQSLAISPAEIREAIRRGIVVYGAASMGALRAADVKGVVGVGRIHDMYRTGTIDRDDEVALLFDPDTHLPVTEPLVNVRYAVERLVSSGTLARQAGDELVKAAEKLHYSERTYPNIIRCSALAGASDAGDLVRLLRNFDLKREDAQFLLETLAEVPVRAGAEVASGQDGPALRVRDREDGQAPVMVWESGDRADFPSLVRFLKVTGAFEGHARNALARMAVGGLLPPVEPGAGGLDAQSLLDVTRTQWGWESPEEAHVTMRDLGLGLADAADSLQAETVTARLVQTVARRPAQRFAKALRAELWMNDLALKRETLRLGALTWFAGQGAEAGPPDEAEIEDARRCVTRLRSALQWPYVEAELATLGLSPEDIDSVVTCLALARRAARSLVAAMDGRRAPRPPSERAEGWRDLGLALHSSPKAPGSNRFVLPEPEAVRLADQIADQVGIRRVGLVGELTTLGVHVAQAFGDRSRWSSSFSSGKAETRQGARAGAIMEEAELHAQDAYQPGPPVRTSFAASSRRLPLIDPWTLSLPYDSRYRHDLEIDWVECADLLGGGTVLVPAACLVGERLPNDVYYSPRLGGKVFSSSGLGSGFSLAEAAVHAVAELIERHAQRLAELELDNPGGVGVRRFWFVDEETLPQTPKRIIGKYREGGMRVRVLDMTADIAVPTFYARIFEDPFAGAASTSSDGFACHPDPEAAVTMALLEAAQTKAGFVAGSREDFSLQARSLGRHERPRTGIPASQVFWFGDDRPVRPFDQSVGFVSGDVLEELEWIVDRVEEAGYRHVLVADYTMARIRPAHAVRAIIPGSETTNPLCTGARGRATCIRDLLPRAARENGAW